ncbi:MAG: peroxidase [Rubrobacter sp.]|nr:peroxidase [Rubrobacter sp.]
MPRLPHGEAFSLEEFRNARQTLVEGSAQTLMGFAVMAQPADTQDFGFLFPELQDDPENLLPQRRATRNALVDLGLAMRDSGDAAGGGNIGIPSAYTYFGQFVDHDITLEASSASLPDLFDPDLEPLTSARIEADIRNTRTAMLELDSVYGMLAPRIEGKMRLGKVTDLGNQGEPFRRPRGKDDNNDLPREPRNEDPKLDRAARIGDPRNDENLIVAQLHVAFLRAHNEMMDRGASREIAKRRLRRHYQHIVIHDFLRRIANTDIVDDVVRNGNRIFPEDEFFMPLEFSAAAYRFGHSMIRRDYEFNINFQPATLDQLFTFTAMSGQLGDNDTLPENWIIQWENFVDVDTPFNHARRMDTRLVEPLFELTDLRGRPLPGDRKSLAVRNLLRGYLLRLPTGQAVARRLRNKLEGVREVTVLGQNQIQNGVDREQARILEAAGFLQRTPLWYYVLAEAAILTEGRKLGPVGSTIVAETLIGLLRRSQDSILNAPDWQPSLPNETPGEFTLSDLLRFAGVL